MERSRGTGFKNSVEFWGYARTIGDLLRKPGFVLPSRWEGMPNALLEKAWLAVPLRVNSAKWQ